VPSRREAPLRSAIAAVTLVAIAFACEADAQDVEKRATDAVPTTTEVRAAIAKLQSDPNLAPERKTRTLKWKNTERPQKPPTIAEWVADLFKWIGNTARIVVWGIIAILVAMFAVVVLRQLRQMELRKAERRSDAPTHVRDLDIRPESLPDDIGAAALALWERGEQRAALSLLYRGLLSRLVHAYQVPIKQSSTEGDCLVLAENQLQRDTADYVNRLIRVWQRTVYGGKEAQSAEVRELCARFSVALPVVAVAGEPT